MSNNNTPTAPDCYHYRRTSSTFLPVEIVRVSDLNGQLVYFDMDRERITPVQNDGLWLGPVPMPGEFILIGDTEDICGLCGDPGADKVPHPLRWPGERAPDTELVHAECEHEECGRAHAALSQEQRESVLRNI